MQSSLFSELESCDCLIMVCNICKFIVLESLPWGDVHDLCLRNKNIVSFLVFQLCNVAFFISICY